MNCPYLRILVSRVLLVSRTLYSNPKWFERVRPFWANSLKPFNLTNEIGMLYVKSHG